MTPERFRYVRDVFEEALEHSTDTRAAFVHERCGGDVEVSAQVQAMLGADAEDGNAIDRLAASSRQALRAAVLPGLEGTRIGPYVVESRIGGGGMGVVYKATRADGTFQKQVALKIIRPEHVNQDSLHRFRQERQILAGLDHPNIARVLDGGSTPDGLPYLVMEYIEGTPIRAYCEAHGLSITDRLKLFRAVTDAVAYAHRHLIVHRDLKPSNILVTADGCIKLLDFGIAKLMPAEADATLPLETQAGLLAMTPAYASPEQVLGRRVTTSSDVYSLGIILFELLAGTRPYDLTGKPLPEMLRLISEADVSTPSSCVTAADSGSRWRRALTGDLDCIVLKALRKEASDRYSSVEQFSDDIERYLCGLPVQATRQTAAYHAVKFVKRHTAGVVAALVSVCALAAALLASLSYADAMQQARNASEVLRLRAESEARRADAEAIAARSASMAATRERDQAVAARQDAERQKRTAEFERRRAEAHATLSAERFSLAWQLIEASLDTPRTRLPRTLVALQRLEQPLGTDAAMRQKLRTAYIRTADQLLETFLLPHARDAVTAYERALSLYAPIPDLTAAERMEVSSIYDKLSDAERRQGHFDRALTHSDRAIDAMPHVEPDTRRMHAIALERQALLRLQSGRPDSARTALALSLNLSETSRHHSVYEQLARVAYATGDYAAAERALTAAIELLRDPGDMNAINASERIDVLARLHESRGDIAWLQNAHDRAFADYSEAIAFRKTQQLQSARQSAYDVFRGDPGVIRSALQISDRDFDPHRDGVARATALVQLVQRGPLVLLISDHATLSASQGRSYYNKAIYTYAKTGRYYEHIRAFSRVHLKRGITCEFITPIAACPQDLGEAEKALSVLIERTKPDRDLIDGYAAVHERLGQLAQGRGDAAAARRHYRIALLHIETGILSSGETFASDALRAPAGPVRLPLRTLPSEKCSSASTVARVLALYAAVSPAEPWAVAPAARLFEATRKRQDVAAGDLRDYARWMLEWAPEHQRDAEKALEVAVRAADMTNHNDAGVLRVLALAAYRCGDYKKAVDAQRKLVHMRPWDSYASQTLDQYERRTY